MTTLTFDTLAYAKRPRDAGVPEPQAEAQATALVDALKGGAAELATKANLAELRQEMTLLRRDMQELDVRLTRDLREMEAKLTRDLREMRLTIKLGAMLVIAIGAVATLVKSL